MLDRTNTFPDQLDACAAELQGVATYLTATALAGADDDAVQRHEAEVAIHTLQLVAAHLTEAATAWRRQDDEAAA